mmetsp:Transcript_17978/g.44865  ORF Transcript_17978/g.44865 Transcript_17978/m.44865 type:complete len:152 (+) Transcript_17978:198-653(+)|eukprot:CAMPEP_0178993798 /NCGR_PEP_ID=MMETSP0795-20121207/6909_1 /TAXON_ID=88552 /ORGANISM="Amoebophrya sp., Strain Ameob2" /LENGTH=151 /DNA_ID=CAMNT_0020685909 /DNA_START=192 /DNA_END=647 /DNA_ORIENTATION=+
MAPIHRFRKLLLAQTYFVLFGHRSMIFASNADAYQESEDSRAPAGGGLRKLPSTKGSSSAYSPAPVPAPAAPAPMPTPTVGASMAPTPSTGSGSSYPSPASSPVPAPADSAANSKRAVLFSGGGIFSFFGPATGVAIVSLSAMLRPDLFLM